MGGAYYEILDKLLVDPILKYTFSKDKKDFIHRQLNITAPDITDSNIKPIHDAYTYLNEQKELKEKQEDKKEQLNKFLRIRLNQPTMLRLLRVLLLLMLK